MAMAMAMAGRLRLLKLYSHGTLTSNVFFSELIYTVLSAKFGRWEQFRQKGGTINKWQQKRLQEKKTIQKDISPLRQRKGQLLYNTIHKHNDADNNNHDLSKDEITTLANRFMRAGALDLWNENDGPLTDKLPAKNENSDNVTDCLNWERVKRKDTVKGSLGTGRSFSFSRGFSSSSQRDSGCGRRVAFSKDEELDKEWYGGQSFQSVEDSSQQEHLGVNQVKAKLKLRKGRAFSVSEGLSDGEERAQSGNSAIPKSLIDDEMELSNIIDEEMSIGMRFEEDLLSRRFYEEDRQGLRGTRYRKFEEEFLSWKHDDENRKDLRETRSRRIRPSAEDYSGWRSKERFVGEDDANRGYRKPRIGRGGGPVSSGWGSRSKRQSVVGFDKAQEIRSHGRGRSFSSLCGSNGRLGRGFDSETETESGQIRANRMGVFVSQFSVQKSGRGSLREQIEVEDKELGFRQQKVEDSWLKFGARFKNEASRDTELSEDEKVDSDTQSVQCKSYEKEQRNGNIDDIKNYRSLNANKEQLYLSSSRFDQCNISLPSLQALSSEGYVQMTALQEATLPVILEGKDVLAIAKSGTGKTLAILLPAIEAVSKLCSSSHEQKRLPIVVLIICPIKELVIQTAAKANALLKYHLNIGVQVVLNNSRLHAQKRQLEINLCQIIVATPGSLLDYIETTSGFSNRLMGLKLLILDEADHLVNLGFHNDLEKIIDVVPKQRQSVLFSATVSQKVQQLYHIALKRGHALINTAGLNCLETAANAVF